ncbi:polysaccharide deacetylase family protein [Salinirubellus salinus]|uniref:Polysaccharide deacetylase family protein n=1 Tax=Salinirubellus salinus TaxID=1364945 RepID=A0A9E7R2P2_9EURY|nr:polysaccharide deacetylase family protein [Salinirubellus salinus]UWM54358.1 polysaccharide deacetylase family protein [Salinirubellus salinus]
MTDFVIGGLGGVTRTEPDSTEPESREETVKETTEEEIQNVLTFDTEHWYSATLLTDAVTDPTTHIQQSVETVLEILARYDAKSTFFVVGEVAQEHPGLVGRIADEGHEVASHGHTHTPLFDLTRETFSEEICRSVEAIEAATGEQVVGFRAPNFSITPKTRWAIETLVEYGFAYDSSIFPVRTPMYGVSNAPKRPYLACSDTPFVDQPVESRFDSPRSNGHVREVSVADGVGPVRLMSPEPMARHGTILELPPAVFHPRFPVPIAGGFYARLLPSSIVHQGIRNLNARHIPATIYFHPWEFNEDVVRQDIPFHKRFISYRGIGGMATKLEKLLSKFSFGPAENLIGQYRGPVDPP